MIYGEGNYSYRPIEGWGARIKKRWPNIQEIAGVTVDDEDCVYLGLLHCRQILYQLSHKRSPRENKRLLQ